MGYSMLYVAFGIVALWLLGEVLLQYKARLRWRVLAFAGFLGVVAGVYERQVLVIVVGALAFGTGQTFVTLSYKRGFSTGWAIGGRPGASRRRRAELRDPVLEVTPVEADYEQGTPAGQDVRADERDPATAYQPVPMHEDSGEYPLYDGRSSYTPDAYTSGGYEGYGAQGYEWGTGEPQPAAAATSYDSGGYQGGYGGGYDQSGGWAGDQGYGYGYAQGQGQAHGQGQGQSGTGQGSGQGYAYPQQTTAATSYDQGYGGGYGQQATGDWTPQQTGGGYGGQQGQGDPYASYGYEQQPPAQAPDQPHSQPYIPPQPHQSPYEQQVQQPAQHYDPYDPYRS